MSDYGNGGDGVLFPDVDELNALGGTSGNTDGVDRHSDGDAAPADDHKVVVVGDVLDGHQIAGLFGDVQGSDTLGTSCGLTVVLRV